MAKGYSTGAPFPRIRAARPDEGLVRLLLADHSSPVSEMTAWAGYMYQRAVLLQTHPQVAKLLEGIALAEARHMQELADAIRVFGGDPRPYAFVGAAPVYWDASGVGYHTDVRDILARDIESEKEEIGRYEAQAEAVSQPQVRALLRRIAEDEKVHLRLLVDRLGGL